MLSPSVRTKLVVILGTPLGHTLSPPMHNRQFNKMGLDYLYLPVEVSEENLKPVFSGLKRMNLAGFNVTIPHKIRIMDLLDELDPLAQVIGAVNTICIQNGKTIGYNTDGDGFLLSLENQLQTTINKKNVIVLGSGGAARSITMTMAARGVSRIFLCNRTASKAEALAKEVNTKVKSCVEPLPLNSQVIASVISKCHVLVNSTSIGMYPNDGRSPIDLSLLFKELIIADLVYKPRETKLLGAARQLGCRHANGLGMLVYQGALAFELWTGRKPIIEEMFSVVNGI